MKILGLSAFHQGSAAALVVDGAVVAAAQEERFSRIQNDATFPARAMRHVLAQAEVDAASLDRVVFYEKPLRRFERLLVHQLRNFPKPAGIFGRTMFTWLGDRLWLKNRIASELGVDVTKVLFASHHQSHAASAFLPSPFEEAAILVADGAGERSTTSLMHGKGDRIEVLAEVQFPHSLGLFYSAFTQYLGFEPDRDEHLVEALAGYGTPRFEAELRELLTTSDDGSFEVEQEPFRFAFDAELLFGEGIEERFGAPRIPGAPLDLAGECREADLAASVQLVVEDALLGLARELKRRVPVDALCVAGALAQNRRAMARLLDEGPFDALHLPLAGDDAGGAIGAALFAWHVENADAPRTPANGALGVEPRDEGVDGAREVADPAERIGLAADALRGGELVGWVQGRSGFGAGSTGGRVCLVAPDVDDAQDSLSRGLAPREPFLPLMALVRAERAAELLELPDRATGPLVAGQITLRAKDALRTVAPAVVAPDGRVRARIVPADDDAGLHALLQAFEERGGPPVLVEAELAARGEPPVRGESEAAGLFARTQLALLVCGERVYERAAGEGR